MKRSPMKPSTKPMSRGKPMKSRPKKREKIGGIDYLALCRGQNCYMRLQCCRNDIDTVVPAHRNEGKGMGLKVAHDLTVPACQPCHAWYDQSGAKREDKRNAWNAAHARWVTDRNKLS